MANIKSLISEEELALFNNLHDNRTKHWETFSIEDYNFIPSIVEKYAESAHFVYELIQNADDALATSATFIVYDDKLIFKHNGKKQFSISKFGDKTGKIGDINSITGFAFSSKKDDCNTIGKFGVGFKSVYQYSNTPRIYDDKFWFKIENYIIPTLLEYDHELRKQGETLFEFDYKGDYVKARNEIINRLHNLNKPTLFLNNLKVVNWMESGKDNHQYKKECMYCGSSEGIKYEQCNTNDCGRQNTLYLFHKDVKVALGIFNISVGYYINNKGEINTLVRPDIHCFFATREKFDSCFISHAPFLLTDSRESIKDFENVNHQFLDEIAKLAADSLVILKDISVSKGRRILTDNVFRIANIKSDEQRDQKLREYYINKLAKSEIILNRSGRYDKLDNMFFSTQKLNKLFSTIQLRELYNNISTDFIYVNEFRQDIKDLQNKLKLNIFDNNEVVKKLAPAFLSSQSEAWCDSLIIYFYEDAQSLWKPSYWRRKREISKGTFGSSDSWADLPLRFAPIVKTNNGSWIAPYTLYNEKANVFLPLESEASFTSESFVFVDSVFAKKHQNFLEELDLKAPEVYDYIVRSILTHYDNLNVSVDTIKNDFLFLWNIYKSGQWSSDLTDIIKSKYAVLVVDSEHPKLSRVDNVYMDSEELRIFFKNEKRQYLDLSFYMNVLNFEDIEELKVFYIKYIGIKDKPQLIRKQCGWFFEMPDYIRDILCTKNQSPKSNPTFEDCKLEGYSLLSLTKQWSISMWNYLSCFNTQALKGEIRWTEKYTLNEKLDYVDSAIIKNLRNDKWICDDSGNCYSPCEITLDDFKDLGYTACALTSLLGFCEEWTDSILHADEAEKIKKIEDERKELLAEYDKKGLDANNVLRNGLNLFENISKDRLDDVANYFETLSTIANGYTQENLSTIANNTEKIGDILDEYFYEPSKIRTIINYIGRKIYEIYLICNKISYEKGDIDDFYDFILENGKKYIKVRTTKKTILDGHVAVGLSPDQNRFLLLNKDIQFRLVRVSITDINLIPSLTSLVGCYGETSNPYHDEHFRDACDKIAEDYWKKASVKEFDEVSPEYAIKIERKN